MARTSAPKCPSALRGRGRNGPARSITAASPPTLVVGTVVWLASEVLFFAGLFAAYFTLRANTSGPWPPRGVDLETAPALVFTLVLVASSFTMHRALEAGMQHDTAGFRRWIVLTIVLAVAFLANQGREWANADFRPDSHAYG